MNNHALVREKLEKMCPRSSASLMAAQRLISDSAYWYSHPNGPAKASRHYERITVGRHGLQLEFGANAFLVGKAIERSCWWVNSALVSAEREMNKVDGAELRGNIEVCVRSSVANHAGDEYSSLWRLYDGHMLFGAQSIHVGDFLRSFWEVLRLGAVCR